MTQIDGDFLLPPCPGLQLIRAQTEPQQLVLTVTSTNPVAFCPVCQTSLPDTFKMREKSE